LGKEERKIKIEVTEEELITIKEALSVLLNQKCTQLIDITFSKPFAGKKNMWRAIVYELDEITSAKTKIDDIVMTEYKQNYT